MKAQLFFHFLLITSYLASGQVETNPANQTFTDSQSTSIPSVTFQNKVYEVWIERPGQFNLRGYMLALTDSGVLFLEKVNLKNPENAIHVPYKHISVVKTRKRGAVGVGTLLGAGLGLATGLIIASTNNVKKDNSSIGSAVVTTTASAVEPAFETAGTVALTGLGGILGAVLSVGKKKIEIYMNPNPPQSVLDQLML